MTLENAGWRSGVEVNPKSKARNSEQYQMIKILNSKQFWILQFESISCFGFRIYDFGFCLSGCSTTVVRTLGVGMTGVQFPAARLYVPSLYITKPKRQTHLCWLF